MDSPSDGGLTRSARIGLRLFAVYVLMYGAFILTAAFRPGLMRWSPPGGVNLAILTGFGLIGGALVLALMYMWLCRGRSDGGQGEAN